MYSNGKLKHGSAINDEFDLLLKRVRSRNGQPHDITNDIRLAVTNAMCALVFGSRYDPDDPEFTKLIKITNSIVGLLAAGSVVDVFSWLSLIPLKFLQKSQKLKKKCKERDELVGRIYLEHVEANRVADRHDLTDAFG